MQASKVWDFIIVGAGSAGCALANRLSASGDKTVLLIEAGGNDNALGLKVPSGIAFGNTSANNSWGYQCQPDPTRNGTVDAWKRGRVLGGSSSINGTIYVRGNAADYDRWADLGNHGWSAKDVMPLFEAMECCDNNGSGRGRKGPLQVHAKTDAEVHPVTQSFIKAAVQSGIPFNDDYNGQQQEGISYIQVTQKRGFRCSSSVAFLKPALHRQNLTVLTHVMVHKVLIENRQAVGIRCEREGVIQDIMARDVILCAGAINSPKLLMLSGIGEAKALRNLGIKPIIDRPAVGKNLREHPLVKLVYRVKTSTYNTTDYSLTGLFRKAGFFLNYLFRGIGPLSIAFESVAFLKTRVEEEMPDIQVHFMPIGLCEKSMKSTMMEPLSFPSVSLYINKNHPTSVGEIALANSDPNEDPLIHSRLLENKEDVDTLVRGYQLVRRIMQTEPFKDLLVEELRPGSDIDDEEAIRAYVTGHTELCYHFAGTCRMGINGDAVVTPDLQVRGVDKLWVADASIMPDLISGNTNAVCMMIGEKLGHHLVKVRDISQSQ